MTLAAIASTAGEILSSILVLLTWCFWCSRQSRNSLSLADQNIAAVAQQDASIGKWAQEQTIAHLELRLCEGACRRLAGAFDMRARSPVKFMNMRDVKVIDEDDFLSNSMMISAKTP